MSKFSIKKREERDEKSQQAEELIANLKSKLSEFKIKLFNDTTFRYNPMNEINNFEELFGKLIIKVVI